MSEIKHILVAATGYPTPSDPAAPFIAQLAHGLSLQGVRVSVIAPQSIIKHLFRKTELHPKYKKYNYENGADIEVYQPYVLSVGKISEKLNDYFLKKSIIRTARKLKDKPDICYGHFWHFAFFLYPFAKSHNIPLFVATGEAIITLHKRASGKTLDNFIDYLKGVICVSSKNKEESVKDGLLKDESKCVIIPNAIDNNLFKRMDKESLRKSYGLNNNDFVVAFTGWYDNNKGAMRVSEAIDRLNDENIKSFFIGDVRDGNSEYPNCKGILHKGRLPHNQIPQYLNMADVFVLPSLLEGCCNAIIEAMACGLPIIASDRLFNRDILTDDNSIMVDPLNVSEISDAIKTLKEDEKMRNKLAVGALGTARKLTLNARIERILNFIGTRILSA